MNLLLKEKLALVSGSTAGIGLAIAEGLLAADEKQGLGSHRVYVQ